MKNIYEYNVTIAKVVDGDTVDVDIDLGFGMVYKKQRVRILASILLNPEQETWLKRNSVRHLKNILKDY